MEALHSRQIGADLWDIPVGADADADADAEGAAETSCFFFFWKKTPEQCCAGPLNLGNAIVMDGQG